MAAVNFTQVLLARMRLLTHAFAWHARLRDYSYGDASRDSGGARSVLHIAHEAVVRSASPGQLDE